MVKWAKAVATKKNLALQRKGKLPGKWPSNGRHKVDVEGAGKITTRPADPTTWAWNWPKKVLKIKVPFGLNYEFSSLVGQMSSSREGAIASESQKSCP